MKMKNLKLVLVYLGNRVPNYVIQNANRLAELFQFDVYLFVDSLENIPTDIDFDARINVREIVTVQKADGALFGHDANFRGGFWLHTFNRLLQIKEIHRELGPNDPILHIEADMLIMPSFPFKSVLAKNLKWFRYNEVSDVASLVYFPSFVETEWLHAQLLNEINDDSIVTDMSALKRIRDRNPSRIEVFQDILMKDVDQRVGIYDGLSLGIWLCGVDPRNTFGMSIIHENSEYKVDDTSDLGDLFVDSEIYLEDGKIKFLREGVVQNIHCLHVHSKDEQLLCVKNSDRLKQLLHFTKDNRPIVIDFRFKVFFKLMRKNLKNGTLISYLRNFVQFLFKRDKIGNPRLLEVLKFMFRKRKNN